MRTRTLFGCLSWQSWALVTLCFADLVSTVWLCRAHDAGEANPIMAYFLAQGVAVFAFAKLVLTAAPLTVLEWARHSKPRVGILGLNTALLGYITLYGAGLAHINGGESVSEASARINNNPAYASVIEQNRIRVEAKRVELAATEQEDDKDEGPGKLLPEVTPVPPTVPKMLLQATN